MLDSVRRRSRSWRLRWIVAEEIAFWTSHEEDRSQAT